MSEEMEVKKLDPLELIEVVPGYRETRSTANLDKALLIFHQKVKAPKKTGEAKVPTRSGKEFSYKYVELSELHKAIDGPLDEAGLVLKQPPIRQGNTYGALTILSHPESGEKIVSGPFLLDNEKGGVQGAGGDCTYSRRYSLCGLLGLAWDDDDDGMSAQGDHTNAQAVSRPATHSAAADTKKEDSNLPYKIPYIKDNPTAVQVNSLEAMCQYVGRKPQDMAAYYKVASLKDLKFYSYRDAYKMLANHLIKLGYTQGRDMNWHKPGDDQKAQGNSESEFPDYDPVANQEVGEYAEPYRP